MGSTRYKTVSPAGAPHADATHLDWTWKVRMPFQGGFLFGARGPMALPWATSEVPLTGRQILRRSALVFCTMQDDQSKGCPSQIIQKNDRGGISVVMVRTRFMIRRPPWLSLLDALWTEAALVWCAVAEADHDGRGLSRVGLVCARVLRTSMLI